MSENARTEERDVIDDVTEAAYKVCETEQAVVNARAAAEHALEYFASLGGQKDLHRAFVFQLSAEGWEKAETIATAAAVLLDKKSGNAARKQRWLDRANLAMDAQDLGERGA